MRHVAEVSQIVPSAPCFRFPLVAHIDPTTNLSLSSYAIIFIVVRLVGGPRVIDRFLVRIDMASI